MYFSGLTKRASSRTRVEQTDEMKGGRKERALKTRTMGGTRSKKPLISYKHT